MTKSVSEQRNEFSLKTFKFNRFMLIRYSLALFFFSNIYWIMYLGPKIFPTVIPLLLILWSLVTIAEHVKLFSNHSNQLPNTQRYFTIQLIVNIALIPLSINEQMFVKFFPFMQTNNTAKIIMFSIIGLGIIISLIILHRIKQIKWNRDKAFIRIQNYEKSKGVNQND